MPGKAPENGMFKQGSRQRDESTTKVLEWVLSINLIVGRWVIAMVEKEGGIVVTKNAQHFCEVFE